jgi:predicted RecB family nuclease
VSIFLDVEGMPEQGTYYLVGLLVENGNSIRTFSLWADNDGEEKAIWRQFLEIIKDYDDFNLFHYGSYEAEYIERMAKRYPDNDTQLVEKIRANSINALSIIYANIYFPTYSNSLKEIGNYLGFKWSSKEASGLQCLAWRHRWMLTQDNALKRNIIDYNIEDCLALNKVVRAIHDISKAEQKDHKANSNANFIFTESLKSKLIGKNS